RSLLWASWLLSAAVHDVRVAWYGSRTLLFDLRIRVLKWARQTGPLMVPAGAGPVTVAPVLPVDPVFEGGPVRVQGAEQVLDRGHGQSHMAGIDGRPVVGAPWGWRLGIGAGAGTSGGHSTHRQGGHDQNGVASDRFIQPDLGLVQAEQVLAELEILLDRPPQPGCGDQPP